VLYGENCRFAVLNSRPGLRVDMALPLEIAGAGAEAPAQPQVLQPGVARGAHA